MFSPATGLPDQSFVLDDRTLQAQLEWLRQYCARMPFDHASTWDGVMFAQGMTPAGLARLAQDELAGDGRMLPHQALLLALLAMLETPRSLFNSFAPCHRQLYYRELLGLKERAAVPDRVPLVLRLEDGLSELPLPAGVLFDAGQHADGAPRMYQLEQPFFLHRGRLSDVRCLHTAPDGARFLHTILDDDGGIAWPAQGVDLAAVGGQAVQPDLALSSSTRMIVSRALVSAAGARTITIGFAQPVENGLFEVSVCERGVWIACEGGTRQGNTFVVTLGAQSPALTQAGTVAELGLDLALPLLRMARTADSRAVPPVTSLRIAVADRRDVLFSTDAAGASALDSASYPFGKPVAAGAGFSLMAADWLDRDRLTVRLTPGWKLTPTELPAVLRNATLRALAHVDGKPGAPLVSPLYRSSASPTVIELRPDFSAGETARGPATDDLAQRGQWLRCELQEVGSLGAGGREILWDRLRVDDEWEESDLSCQYIWIQDGFVLDEQLRARPRIELLLGLQDTAPGQPVSLYWQLRGMRSHRIDWFYLKQGGRWASLDAFVTDGTQGWSRSGIWSAQLPADALSQGTAPVPPAGASAPPPQDAGPVPVNRLWVRASIAPARQGLPWLDALKMHVASARLVIDGDVEAGHFLHPLAAGTIIAPVERIDGLAEVMQPWPSAGGQATETEAAFLQRAARQLAHRGRALGWRDIDSLLRTRYPEVRGLLLPPAALPDGADQGPFAVVVLPAFGRHDNDDALRPAFGAARLQDMMQYLFGIASPWLRPALRLVNPEYVDVALRYDVDVRPGADRTHVQRQLGLALAQRYMAWGHSDSPIGLGNGLDYYGVVAFLQAQQDVVRVRSLTLDGRRESIAPGNSVLILQCAPA